MKKYSDMDKVLYSWRDCRRAYIYGFVFGLLGGLTVPILANLHASFEKAQERKEIPSKLEINLKD